MMNQDTVSILGDDTDLQLNVTQPINTLNALMIAAVNNNDLEQIQTLLTDGADLNVLEHINVLDDNLNITLLMSTIWSHGDVITARFLLEHGIDIDARDNSGHNALMYAITTGSTDVACLLIAAGADINTPDTSGHTPLMLVFYTEELGESEGLLLPLIQAGADVNAEMNGQTVLSLATAYHREDAINIFTTHSNRLNTIANFLKTEFIDKNPLALTQEEKDTIIYDCTRFHSQNIKDALTTLLEANGSDKEQAILATNNAFEDLLDINTLKKRVMDKRNLKALIRNNTAKLPTDIVPEVIKYLSRHDHKATLDAFAIKSLYNLHTL